jgi:ATP-dependent helicase/nuclease subunit A
MHWTKEQKRALEIENSSITLSAAAGSGKTAVLIERIMKKILNNKEPININEMLVLTFSEEIANELKEKISEKINKSLKKDPNNTHLKTQTVLIDSTNISTIHSFCYEVIKNNFYLSNLSADFSIIINEKEIKNKILNNVLNSYYKFFNRNPSFKNLFLAYNGKDDENIKKIILDIHEFCRNMPSFYKWFDYSTNIYKNFENINHSENLWEQEILKEIKFSMKEVIKFYEKIIKNISFLPKEHKYVNFFNEESQKTIFISKKIINSQKISEIQKIFDTESNIFMRLPSHKKNEIYEEYKIFLSKIKSLREKSKKITTETLKKLVNSNKNFTMIIKKSYKTVKIIKNIVLRFNNKYKNYKQKNNQADFNDLEVEMLNVLRSKNEEINEFAKNFKKRYKEILIDECQDINYIQDKILNLISDNGKNIFRVGDIKQSIYRFRNSAPELFIEKYINRQNYLKNITVINLLKNFRSRREIINFINFLFSKIMSKEVGEVEYNNEQKLIYGAEYPENKNCIEVILTNSPEEENHSNEKEKNDDSFNIKDLLEKIEKEAIITAKKIKKMQDKKFKIYDLNNKKMREMKLNDIAIIMRSPGKSYIIYEKIFNSFKIPIHIKKKSKEDFPKEILALLSLLGAINNPIDDNATIGAMISDFFGFSLDELAKIKIETKKNYYFDCVKIFSDYKNKNQELSKKCKYFVNCLVNFENYSSIFNLPKLLSYIYENLSHIYISKNKNLEERINRNLEILLEKAYEFDIRTNNYIKNFLNFIQNENSEIFTNFDNNDLNKNENAVKIMSIHNSKGLEFPIVFLNDCAKNFNKTDLNKSFLWHKKYGIGFDYINYEERIKYNSLPKQAIRSIKKKEMFSEEMRLLYVALTRCKEKLIIIGTINKNIIKKSSEAFEDLSDCNKISTYNILARENYLEWMIPCLLLHKDAENLRKFCDTEQGNIETKKNFDLDIKILKSSEIEMNLNFNQNKIIYSYEKIKENEKKFLIQKKLPVNDYELKKYPKKTSVSNLINILIAKKTFPKNLFLKTKKIQEAHEIEKKINNASNIGLINHFIMRHIDLEKINIKKNNINLLIEKMIKKGLIYENQVSSINVQAIEYFFSSNLGRRLLESKKIIREMKFCIFIPISEFSAYFSTKIDENVQNNGIQVSGTIDCAFQENNEIIIMDFKTENAENATKIDYKKYSLQLYYYQKGIERVFKKNVKEKYLYFFSKKNFVQIV